MTNDIEKMDDLRPQAMAYAPRPKTPTWVPILIVIFAALTACIAYMYLTDVGG